MGWLPFTSKKPTLDTTQIEQKSHIPLSLAPADSDISHTLGQISADDKLTVRENTERDPGQVNKSVKEFVEQRPNNMFIIDGEKDIEQSIICTSNETGGKTCVKLQYNSIQLFKQMQHMDYFCSLPDDIDATYFECRKIK